MKALLVLALLVLAAAAFPTDPRLKGAKVVRVVPQTLDQLHHLHQLLLQGRHDFWQEPRALGSPVDIMATTRQLPQLAASLEQRGMEVKEHISDVSRVVEEQRTQRYKRSPQAMDWTAYHDSDTINRWMAQLASDHPDLCTLETVGKSYEGRPMNLLTVGKGGADKPGIFIDGGIHAREWISPATVTFLVNQLVTNSSAHDDLLSSVNFYFMPVINPDGYDYSFTDDRLWRKTRSNTSQRCKGVDANRNWDFHWMEIGASDNPCSDIYAGPEPFSEVEMRVVRDQLTSIADIKVYLSLHSFSQLWMYPWGFTSSLPHDWRDLDHLAREAVTALTGVHGTSYQIGSLSRILYPVGGSSQDWAKGIGGIKYSYILELRDTGTYGFLLPASQIIPCGEEVFQAFNVVANFVRTIYTSR
ncbi:hypothetical protein O3P69_004877 [Scylla paramamosain]|uniref:Peptidase M14 domain-containing protein n=1 Tax=Scylla paramamosain TaxID=85552 RepID=A0AAW0UDM3_SCYPA